MDIAQLGLEIRSDGVVVASDRLNKFGRDAQRAEGATDGLSRAFRTLGPLVGTVMAAFSVRALGQYADAWSDMQSKVGAAIKDMEAAPAMMRRMVDMANASYSPLEQTVEVYSRNVAVLRDLGYAADGAADFAEALNHALVITATRGERAASVQNALSKAMAVGKLSGDGLETVLTSGGRVAEALAAQLGTNVSGLRAMASQGKITGSVIAAALTSNLAELRIEAGEMAATLGDAGAIATNVLTEWVGRIDQAWGVSGRLADKTIEVALSFRDTADTVIRLGNVVGAILGPGLDAVGNSLGSVAQYAGIATAALAGFYAPALVGGIGSLTVAIGAGLVGAIRAVGVAMMANPLGLFIAAIAAAVTAAFMFRDEIKQAIGVDVVEVMVDVGNKTIGVFVGAYQAVKEQWSNLPTFFSAIGKKAWNSFLESFEGPALTIDTPWGKWESGGIDLSGAQAKLSPAENASFNTASGTFNQSYMDGNYIQGLSNSVGELWSNAEGATGAMQGLLNAASGNATDPAGTGSGKGKKDPYGDLIRSGQQFIAGQRIEAQALGQTAEAANRLRYEQELLNKAANDNIKLTPGQRNELSALAAEMAAVEERTRSLTEWYNIGRSTFGSFMSDFRRDLMNGTSLWESFGNAAAKALDSIAERALSMAANGLFDMIFGAFMGSLGGGNSLGGGWGVAGGFGRPGIFGIPGFANGTNSAPGGLAWVGERGPELVNLPRGSQVIPNGPSMALAANQNSGDIVIHNVINVPPGTSADVAPAIAREVTKELRRQLPDAMERYNRNPLRRAG
jgi:tape measure domain-containing protein